MSQQVSIWTDGACSGNPGPGGWGAVLRFGGHEKELKGGEALTTNNRMELTAALRALQALKRPVQARLHTDSEYVRRGISECHPSCRPLNLGAQAVCSAPCQMARYYSTVS